MTYKIGDKVRVTDQRPAVEGEIVRLSSNSNLSMYEVHSPGWGHAQWILETYLQPIAQEVPASGG